MAKKPATQRSVAKPAMASKRSKRATKPAITPKNPAAPYPFIFVGQGVGVAYKCLECFAWFKRAPSKTLQAKIKAVLPLPVTSFVRFSGDIMHFGSDDNLELRVKAAAEPAAAALPFKTALRNVEQQLVAGNYAAELLLPSTQTWRAFAQQFERAMVAIHALAPLRFVIKPDEETQGGHWHRWSMSQASDVAVWALRPGKPTAALAWLALTMLESFDEDHLPRIAPPARLAWLALLDKLHRAGPKNLRDDCQDFAVSLLFSFKKREHQAVLATLSKPMQAAIAAHVTAV